ncbi:MAG TPA: YfiR family protein [Rhodocyclaceae bacterium]
MKTGSTRSKGFFVGLVAAVVLGGPLCGGALAQARPSAEEVRAAMVFSFLRFTEFPADAAADPRRLRLCFSVGDANQAEALQALAGRKLGNRELTVVRLGNAADDCQVLYTDSRQRWNAAQDSRIGTPLTISNYRGFVGDGGMIEIDMQSDGNRFEINLAQARQARLRLSPQLLRLARQVHE